MVWKKVNNSDAGTGTKHGGNDIDKISDLFSAVADVDTVDINSNATFRADRLKVRNSSNSFSTSLNSTGLTVNRTQTFADSDYKIVTSPPFVFKQFRVYKVGGSTYIADRFGHIVQGPSTDTAAVVQAQIDPIPINAVYEFVWDADTFTIENPIILPTITAAQVKKVKMQGQGFVPQRNLSGGCTNLQPSATFPENRYVFELNNPGPTVETGGQFEIDGFQCTNSDNFTRMVGFIKLECGAVQI